MPRPTVQDIAVAAGVSVATVDRALNGRAGVRPETILKVNEAVERLNYVRNVDAANLAKRRTYPILFIVPEGANAFMRALEAEIRSAVLREPLERTEIEVATVPAFNERAILKVLDGVDPARLAGVVLVATDSVALRRRVDDLAEAGVAVVTLVSDLPNSRRAHFAGIDNVSAGRTAAGLLGRFLDGRDGAVAVVAGSMVVRDHVERRLGFEQVMRSEYPSLQLLPTIEGLDEATRVEDLLGAQLQRNPDTVGIYSLGAGNRGVGAALTSAGFAGKVRVVAHELTGFSREALANGLFDAIISQDPGHEVRSAIRVIKAQRDGVPVVGSQERIRIEIFLRDNLP